MSLQIETTTSDQQPDIYGGNMTSRQTLFFASATALILLFTCSALFAAETGSLSYQSSKGKISSQPAITSPAQINAVAHPISSNKPMRKYHKPPMVPPADEVAKLVRETYDPTNPHHVLDPTAGGTRGTEGYAPCKSFVGIINTGWNPPDPHLAVGPNHIVEVVNSSIAVYDKNSGERLLQSTAGFWFQNTVPAPPSGFIYDPKVIYDPDAERFVLLYLCTDDVSQASYLVSASQSSDAMGSWYSYNFDATVDGEYSSFNWADYPGLGFDYSDAIYITSNQWQFGGGYQYVKIRILPKSELYGGRPVPFSDIWNIMYHDGSKVFTIKPATTYSDANGEFLLSNIWYGANYTTYWKITDPLALVGGPFITRKPKVNLASAYPSPPEAAQQGGAGIGLLGSMTQEVTYRNGKVYTCFDQSFNWGSGAVSAIRVLGIDTATSTAVLDKVYGADLKYYYFPSIYVDPANRIFAAFNRSANNEYPGIHYVEDMLNDPASKLLKSGEGYHAGSAPVRWGDYSGIAPDASDQTKLWICDEYSPTSPWSWQTWIGQIPSLVVKPTPSSPAAGALVTTPVQLSWDQAQPAPPYRLQVDNDSGFLSLVLDTVIYSNLFTLGDLTDRTVYYWRVEGATSCPTNQWSDRRSFKVCNYVSGDANGSENVDISDAVYLITYIFASGPAPVPEASGDANCDLAVDVSDAVYLISYIFSSGPAPCNPC